jgi:hypothetical protein
MITLTSSGGAPVQISGVTLGGANPADFTLGSGCSGTLAVNARCGFTVNFAPMAVGERTATITISDSTANSPQTIPIGGNAVPAFAIGLGAGPNPSTSATVTAGQSAEYDLLVSPGSGFTGSISFACTGVPVGVNCSVPSLQVANETPISFKVSITTSGTSAVPSPVDNLKVPRLDTLRLSLLMLCGLLLWIYSRRLGADRRLTNYQFAWRSVSCAIFFMAVLQASACGGGPANSPVPSVSTTPPSSVVTPPGTSAIVVTPNVTTSNGTQLAGISPIQLSLTVK